MKTIKNLEFRRFKSDKDDPQQFPTFYQSFKPLYEVRTAAPETEKEIIKEWRLIKIIERSSDWTSSVQDIIDTRKDVLMFALIELRAKELK